MSLVGQTNCNKWVLAAMLTLGGAPLAQAAMVTIDNMPADEPASVLNLGPFGDFPGKPFFAQSFVATADGIAQNLSFALAHSGTGADVGFRVLLTETSGGTGLGIVPGANLFTSADLNLATTVTSNETFTVDFTSGPAINLTAGTTYAWILDADGVAGVSGSATVGSRDGYTGGHFFTNTTLAGEWADSLTYDLAFKIETATMGEVPLPAGLPLLLSGLVGLVAVARRRQV